MSHNKEEVRSHLDLTREEIAARVEALQDEVTDLYDGLRDVVRNKPLLVIGGTVVVGALIGAFIATRGSRGRGRAGKAHHGLVAAFTDAVTDEVEQATRQGRNAADAVRDALQERVPLIVVQQSELKEKVGMIRQGIEFLVSSAVGYAARSAVDLVSRRFVPADET